MTTSVVLLVVFLAMASGASMAAEIDLSDSEKRVMLTEAIDLYHSALAISSTSEAEKMYADSAARFQILVDSGTANDKLLSNLGTSYLQSGDAVHAALNFRRALRLNPSNNLYHQRLRIAQRGLGSNATDWRSRLQAFNNRILDWISPRGMQWLSSAAWGIFWGTLIAKVAWAPARWKSIAVVSLLTAAVSGTSYLTRVLPMVRDDVAVIMKQEIELREGDGEEFPIVLQAKNSAGRVAEVLAQRSRWTQVRLDGSVGWCDSQSLERI